MPGSEWQWRRAQLQSAVPNFVEVIPNSGITQPATATASAHARSPSGHWSGRGWESCICAIGVMEARAAAAKTVSVGIFMSQQLSHSPGMHRCHRFPGMVCPQSGRDWPFSSFLRDVAAGLFPEDWAGDFDGIGEFGEA